MVTIPWMLLVNPYLLWREEKAKRSLRARRGGDFELNEFKGSSNYEVFIDEQVIKGLGMNLLTRLSQFCKLAGTRW